MTTLPTLEDVTNEMTMWRQTRGKRGRIPDELKVKISALSPHYRVSKS